MVADLGVEYRQQALELVQFYLEHLEFVSEELLKSMLHQVLEESIGVFFVPRFEVEIACDVVHALAVADLGVVAGIRT